MTKQPTLKSQLESPYQLADPPGVKTRAMRNYCEGVGRGNGTNKQQRRKSLKSAARIRAKKMGHFK